MSWDGIWRKQEAENKSGVMSSSAEKARMSNVQRISYMFRKGLVLWRVFFCGFRTYSVSYTAISSGASELEAVI